MSLKLPHYFDKGIHERICQWAIEKHPSLRPNELFDNAILKRSTKTQLKGHFVFPREDRVSEAAIELVRKDIEANFSLILSEILAKILSTC